MEYGTCEGDTCKRRGCNGVIETHEVENCSCHISPPCSACTSPRNHCKDCGWEEADDITINRIRKSRRVKYIYRLSHDIARANAVECVRTAKEGWIVEVKEPNRSLEQNAMIHALLTEVGAMLGWRFNGQAVDLDDLKTIFMAAYRKAMGETARFAIGIDGQPVMLNWRTRDLTKREASDFVEMVHAWMADNEGRKTA